ncbi:MAG TPA: tetratricopeptide repeat protein [Candidatus Nitrosotalea sp.]|nr:tetratricopeptide repeat protein [Candidatus Nitrosotalea sp.]
MGLATFLERTWSGLTGLVRPRSAASLFRLADQYRHEGRYEEAADLIAEGLRSAPNIAVGHLLDAYLHVVFREMPAAKDSFRRVLSLDPYHPRALFGLARIALEEGDIEGCRPFLDRAIQYFPDFPEAKALQEMVATWSAPAVAVPAAVGTISTDRLRPPPGARDLVLAHTDGTLVFAQGGEERQRQLAQHVTQVFRIASATLARAGLGALRRGVVEGVSEMTFLRSDGGVILGVALPHDIEVGAGLVQVGRLWTDLNIKA